MDESVEACDDFYNFAWFVIIFFSIVVKAYDLYRLLCHQCSGNFIKNTMIPDEKVSVNTFSIIGDKLQEQLRALISEERKPTDSPPFKLVKNLYTACMNKSLIEERGLKPLFNITDTLGGWPVVEGMI